MATAGMRTAGRRNRRTVPDARSVDGYTGTIIPMVVERQLPVDLHPARAWHIRRNERKWVNGTTLHYSFFARNSDGSNGAWIGSSAQKAVVRGAFEAWKDAGIGLNFREVPHREDAELRIGFMAGDGCWSCLGRDAVDIARDADERTMNFSGDPTTSAAWQAALFHVGRALGFAEIDENSFRRAGLKAGLPDEMVALAQRYFPPVTATPEAELLPGRSHLLALAPGEQLNFRIAPLVTRTYTIQTFGTCDAVMVLFEELGAHALYEEKDGETEFLAGSDDSGTDDNARIRIRLHRDREYVLRIRLYFRNMSRESAILMW